MLRVCLVGEVGIEVDGQSRPLPRGRPLSLLGWLALNPGLHPRTDVAPRFWPDVLDESARASLRSALWALRRPLGDALVATRDRVGLAADAWVDVVEADRLRARRRCEEALALCEGTLLPGARRRVGPRGTRRAPRPHRVAPRGACPRRRSGGRRTARGRPHPPPGGTRSPRGGDPPRAHAPPRCGRRPGCRARGVRGAPQPHARPRRGGAFSGDADARRVAASGRARAGPDCLPGTAAARRPGDVRRARDGARTESVPPGAGSSRAAGPRRSCSSPARPGSASRAWPRASRPTPGPPGQRSSTVRAKSRRSCRSSPSPRPSAQPQPTARRSNRAWQRRRRRGRSCWCSTTFIWPTGTRWPCSRGSPAAPRENGCS